MADKYSSVWTRPPRRQRDQPQLSREQIVAEALKLLDEEGIDALSMRRLGSRLGSVATAIYWHVATKDDLVELVIDEIYAEAWLPEDRVDPAEWRQTIFNVAHSLRSVIHRHPWVASAPGLAGLGGLGPNLTGIAERLLGVFVDAGFTLREADHCLNAVFGYVMGIAVSEATSINQFKRSGLTREEWTEREIRPVTEDFEERYPHLAELYSTLGDAVPETVNRDNFDYGLDRILDGLEGRLPFSSPPDA
ncbi:TetR/AcrR family transcriptional regulator [Nonomuraea sp. NPDC050404]|uniref:TetR/AcrR family transcriptional regulator n=1 Tax=Nonomuraea sp. NPDC050404 TaxID=3155783 RepID=UPI0033E10589